MTTPTATGGNQSDSNDVGERTELGRYRTAAGVERVLYGQRVAKVVRVTDVPVDLPAVRTSSSVDSRRTVTRRCSRWSPTISKPPIGSASRRCPRRSSDSRARV